MNIVHIAPNSPYNDNWGYQDNLLPKYQRKLGHNVTVIVSNKEHRDGGIVEIPEKEYDLEDGQHIIRRKCRDYHVGVISYMKSYMPVYDKLLEIRPDLIFFHGLLSDSIFDAIKYKKQNKACVIVQDNHMDDNIGKKSDSIFDLIIRQCYRCKNKKSIPFVSKVYGVTPWRQEYAQKYFGIPAPKTDLLIMGADDDKVDLKNKNSIRNKIRSKYKIRDDDFLIVSGGKIDNAKKITLLMQACAGQTSIKLLLFGNVADDVKDQFNMLLQQNSNIVYIGWIESDMVYDYFFASDLVIFPGQHSVLWEQACASKVPCVFEKWDGMDHVNNGGNSDFVFPVTVETLRNKIEELRFTEKYYSMKELAESNKTDIYLYSKIAEKSLECVINENR